MCCTGFADMLHCCHVSGHIGDSLQHSESILCVCVCVWVHALCQEIVLLQNLELLLSVAYLYYS